MRTKLFVVIVLCLIANYTFAYWQYNGIYYAEPFDGGCAVTCPSTHPESYGGGAYSGDVIIPSYVYYTDPLGYWSGTYKVNAIGSYAFNRSRITNVSIPTTVTSIGKHSFTGCGSLPSITIPNSVTSIGDYAFSHCNFTRVTLPSSVTKIGEGVFAGCPKLQNVIFQNTILEIYASMFQSCTSLTSFTIPSSVTKIGEYAFSDCTNLKNVTIPSSVSQIESYAFDGCTNLETISLPSSISKIEEYTFHGCTNLRSVTLPSSITKIGEYAFGNCPNLDTIYFPDLETWCKIQFTSDAFSASQYHLVINGQEIKDLAIPSTITEILPYTFAHCASITSVSIPSSVVNVGKAAFYKCLNLPVENGLRYADTYLVDADGKKSSYIVKTGTKWIGTWAFANNKQLTSISLPSSLMSIGLAAFSGCTSLSQINIPNLVKTIEQSAFRQCTDLEEVVLGEGILSIDQNAFAGCSRLAEITCFAGRTPDIYQNTFSGVNTKAWVFVLPEYYHKYEIHNIWSAFVLKMISASPTTVENQVIVTPHGDNAIFTWPVNASADEYNLEITKDGELFCTLRFNAEGQLNGIAFVPNRGHSHDLVAAKLTTKGWQFTITGLDQASKYSYTLDALNANQQLLMHYQGEFVTDGYTNLEENTLPLDDKNRLMYKIIKDGHLYILNGKHVFNAIGGLIK